MRRCRRGTSTTSRRLLCCAPRSTRRPQAKGETGLTHGELSSSVFDAMSLPFDEYAADPDVRGPARTATHDALRRVIEYYLYRDLQRLWRVTAPNLEDCGLLRFEYEGLKGADGCPGRGGALEPGLLDSRRPECRDRSSSSPVPLQRCPPEVREELATTLLDVLRRNLAIKVDVLDATSSGISSSRPSRACWRARSGTSRSSRAGDSRGRLPQVRASGRSVTDSSFRPTAATGAICDGASRARASG